VGEKTEELETMRKNYGKLAGRVYNASVAGADFTTAAIIKIGCAIVNGARALPNINNEFKGARGVYNLTMVVSRVKMIISAFGFYQKIWVCSSPPTPPCPSRLKGPTPI